MRQIKSIVLENGATYHLDVKRTNPYVLTGGDPDRIKVVAREYLDPDWVMYEKRGLVTVNGTYKGMPITVFSTGMGPSSVAITLPEIIEACDSDSMKIIRIGTSGALNKDLNIGDFVATTQAEISEGVSEKIMGPGYEAHSSPNVRAAILEATNQYKHPFQEVYEGMTRVSNDFYWDGEKSKEMGSRDDVLAVSMEFSVIAAVADWYNLNDPGRDIQVGNLLAISDNVVAEEEHIDMNVFEQNQPLIRDAHIKSGLEALFALYQEDLAKNHIT